MSVINQMLRDLDGRGKPASTGAGQGVQSVAPLPPLPAQRSSRSLAWPLAAVVLLAAGAGVWVWQWRSSATDAPAPSSMASNTPAPLPQAPVSEGSLPAAQKAALRALDAELSLRLDGTLDIPPLSPPSAPAPDPVPVAAPAKAAPPAKPVSTAPAPSADAKKPAATAAAPAAKPVASTVTTTVAPPAAPVSAPGAATAAAKAPVVTVEDKATAAQRQVGAVQEALAQAQGLWALGNQTGAVELLRDTAQSAEKASGQPGMDAALAAVVREWARMLLAQGRVAEAHDLLVRHEPRLRAIPEAWALRANAAQRLGQHQDSVQAYMQALQARPNEQRWLLGLAVSLAAMGQTATAADVVERARAEGPINRDIAAYLRQMGVVIK